jgi:hypothetical protein
MMIKYEWFDVDIILSIIFHDTDNGATEKEIVQFVDYKQHMILTNKELNDSLNRFIHSGLIIKIDEKYKFGLEISNEMMNSEYWSKLLMVNKNELVINENPIIFFILIKYLLNKLIAAGFAATIFFITWLILNGFKLIDLLDFFKQQHIVLVIFLYGITCSLIIDYITKYISKNKNNSLGVVLYIIAGFSFFIFYTREVGWLLFLGVFGVGSALLFYLGIFIANKKLLIKYIFIIFPILILYLMFVLLDRKVNWTEVRTDSTYEAKFDYFIGSKEIPINMDKGQTLIFLITWDTKSISNNGGATGQHVLNPDGKYYAFSDTKDYRNEFTADANGVYKIVADADRLKGSFKLTWTLED